MDRPPKRRKELFAGKRKELEIAAADTEGREEREVRTTLQPWPAYDYTLDKYVEHFTWRFPGIANLRGDIAAKKAEGREVLVVDVCGAANGHSFGADRNIALTYKDWDKVFVDEWNAGNISEDDKYYKYAGVTPEDIKDRRRNQEVVEGDVFEEETIQNLEKAIEKTGLGVNYLFFNPIKGMENYRDNVYAPLHLYKTLTRLYRFLAEDGEVYLDADQFMDEIHALRQVYEHTDLFSGITMEFYSDDYRGKTEAIHIRRTPDSPNELPGLQEIINAHAALGVPGGEVK